MTRRKLNPDERQIWQKVTQSVTPLHPEPVRFDPDPVKSKLSKVKKGEVIDGLKAPLPTKPSPRPKPAPPDISAERKLRRGRVEIDARIDLHGMTQAAARKALGHFLHGARSRGYKTVLVITGKGKAGARTRDVGEEAPGVIKRRFPDWISEPELRHLVSGYSTAHQRHGGSGAFYVRIRSGRTRE